MRKDLIEEAERAVALAALGPWKAGAGVLPREAIVMDAHGRAVAHVYGTDVSDAHHNAQAIAAMRNAMDGEALPELWEEVEDALTEAEEANRLAAAANAAADGERAKAKALEAERDALRAQVDAMEDALAAADELAFELGAHDIADRYWRARRAARKSEAA